MKPPEKVGTNGPSDTRYLNGAGERPKTVDQIIEKWAGVFEDEFWEEVLKARPPVPPRNSKASK